MKKLLFLSLVLMSTCTLMSCQTNSNMPNITTSDSEMEERYSNMEKGDLPVSIVFEKWNYDQIGVMIRSVDVILSGKNKSGDAVEVKTSFGINDYDENTTIMKSDLDKAGQLVDGITGSGVLKFNKDGKQGLVLVAKVGDVVNQNMVEFKVDEDVVNVFKQ